MFFESTLSPDLVQAYRETHYRVSSPEELTLVIGCRNEGLARLHRAFGAGCSAFVTACNPYSAHSMPEQNAERQSALAGHLRARGLAFVEGFGQHPENGWPAEASFLVFGMDLEASRILGMALEQNAIVWSGEDAVPTLILLR